MPVSLQIIGKKILQLYSGWLKKKSTKFSGGLWAQSTKHKLRLWILDLQELTRKRLYDTSTARHVLSDRLRWMPTLCISKEIVALGCGGNNNVKVELRLQKGSRSLVRTGATVQRPLLLGTKLICWLSQRFRCLRWYLTLSFSCVPSEQKITGAESFRLDSLVMPIASTSWERTVNLCNVVRTFRHNRLCKIFCLKLCP